MTDALTEKQHQIRHNAPIMDPLSGPLVGAYLLIITVTQPCAVVFGRYQAGQPVVVQSGQLLYIGSARGSGDHPRMAQRILRHLTRTGDAPPHALRAQAAAHFRQSCPVTPPRRKQLRWHIDYLLDRPEATVSAIWLARGDTINETSLYTRLHATGLVAPVAYRLGASDHPQATHLLYWHESIQALQSTLGGLCQHHSNPIDAT